MVHSRLPTFSDLSNPKWPATAYCFTLTTGFSDSHFGAVQIEFYERVSWHNELPGKESGRAPAAF